MVRVRTINKQQPTISCIGKILLWISSTGINLESPQLIDTRVIDSAGMRIGYQSHLPHLSSTDRLSERKYSLYYKFRSKVHECFIPSK